MTEMDILCCSSSSFNFSLGLSMVRETYFVCLPYLVMDLYDDSLGWMAGMRA